MDLISNIEKLSAVPGVSGREDAVRAQITNQLDSLDCTYDIDALGNVLAFKKGVATPKNKLLFAAHMDEVGFVVTMIEDNGLLRFATVGGIDNRVITGRAVKIGDAGLHGVIGLKAVHLQEEKEREQALSPDKLFIDVGAVSREDAEKYVKPGDAAIFSSSFARFGDNKIMGKALDDRAGCALLLDMIASELAFDCHFAFTVQEETGCTGAITAGYTVEPDIAVVVEATTASDIAGVEPDKVVCSLGKGGVISFMDKGAVYDHELYRLVTDAAKEKGIPCQTKLGVFGGNDSRSLQTASGGARVMAISLPCRYLHTASNVLDIGDIENTAKLLRVALEAAGMA